MPLLSGYCLPIISAAGRSIRNQLELIADDFKGSRGVGKGFTFVQITIVPFHASLTTMVPGSLIGMYGGMMFAMRETMQHPTSLDHAIRIGIVFGIIVVAAMQLYDQALRVGQSAEE